MYKVVILSEAERDLEQLNPPVAKRINKRVKWLAQNFEQIKPESLTGEGRDSSSFGLAIIA